MSLLELKPKVVEIKILFLILFLSISNSYSQEIESSKIKLEPLNWDIMYCGNTDFGENKPSTLYIKNETNFPIQGYWLNYYNNLAKVKFGKIAPKKTKKLNLRANEYWVFSDLNNNALGVFQTVEGINEIIIDSSNFKNSVKLPTSIQDKSIPGTPSGGQILIEQASYDVLSYDLKLEIFPETKFIKGKNIITAKVLEDLNDFVFDLDSLLTIENVYLKKNDRQIKLPVETIEGKHWCRLPLTVKKEELIRISIEYGGNPRIATHAPYKGGFSWNQTKDCKPWIATSCQMDGADLWIPCKDYQWDEPESVTLSFTVPNGLKAISNGVLIEEIKNNNQTTTYNWKTINPINNYDIALNIAPYSYIQDSYVTITKDSLNLGYWVLPENVDGAKEFYGYSKKYLTFLESLLGPYPFRKEKLGIVEVPFVAMEHQTIIAYGPNTTVKYPEYNATLFHEICHEWFGNMVTAKYWKDYWIHESLDAYLEALYEESIQGEEAYKQKIKSFNWKLENKVPLAPKTIGNSRQLYSGDSYKKGAYLLHTLRYLIGKDNLLKILRLMSYPDKNMELINDGEQCRFTTTEEFFSIAEKVSGQDLDWFKNVYFRNAALPEISITENREGVIINWVTKDNMYFPMPLEIETKDGISKIYFKDGLAQLDFRIEDIIEIDPNNWILFSKSE